MSDDLGKELREAALAIQRAAQHARCYSVIQHVVTAATDHISALAGGIEKTARIVALEAEREAALRSRAVLPPKKGERPSSTVAARIERAADLIIRRGDLPEMMRSEIEQLVDTLIERLTDVDQMDAETNDDGGR